MAEFYQGSRRCNSCSNATTYHCNTCLSTFGDNCKEIHKNENKKWPESQTVCKLHNEEIFLFWCETCQSPACIHCVTSSHKGHQLIKTTERMEIQRGEINNALKRIREDLKEWEMMLSKAKTVTTKFMGEVCSIENSLNDQAFEMHKAVDIVLQERKKELEQIKQDGKESLEKQELVLQDGINGVYAILKKYDDLGESTGFELMGFTADEIILPAMPAQTPISGPLFSPVAIDQTAIANLFGCITKPPNKSSDSSCVGDQMSTLSNAVEPEIDTEQEIDKTRICREEETKTKLTQQNIISTFYIGKCKNDICIACTSSGLTWMNIGDGAIELRNSSGEVMRKVYTVDLNDMAYTKDGQILITDSSYSCIKSVSESKGVTTIFNTEGIPYGICCLTNGHMVVTFRDISKSIVMYGTKGEKLARKVLKSTPGKVAESKVSNLIYVCSKNGCLFSTGNVVALDIGLRLRYKYIGPDKSFDPRDVCCDGIGHVLVVNIKSNQIYILTTNCRFLQYLSTGNERLDRPLCIDVDSNSNLWIAERGGHVKVVRYSQH